MKVDVEYYDLSGHELHFKICPGDLQIVCNVLFDYCNMLSEMLADPPDGVDQGAIELWRARYGYYLERIQKIRWKIESGIGYSTEKAIAKCKKRKLKKDDDIGEDALVMAMKVRISGKTKKEEKSDQVAEHGDQQLSLFDMESTK